MGMRGAGGCDEEINGGVVCDGATGAGGFTSAGVFAAAGRTGFGCTGAVWRWQPLSRRACRSALARELA